MCGIAVVFSNSLTSSAESVFQKISEVLQHRGPDHTGWRSFPVSELGCQVGLGHFRLSILDLTPAAHQPMGSVDQNTWITYNGEIYNYLELRAELESLGHRFNTSSDTEVLLAAYTEWGMDALTRLVGMFAFAILDLKEKKLFLARDPMGIKPLYYAFGSQGFAAASEIPALLKVPGVGRKLSPQRIFSYLRFGLTDYGSETLFQDILQVEKGTVLVLDLTQRSSPQIKSYWNLDSIHPFEGTAEEASAELRELFMESIRLHLRSDVPLGAALSGGVDSSSIVMTMRKILGKNSELHAFSYFSQDPEKNEERWAKKVVEASGAILHPVQSHSENLTHDMRSLITFQGEPFSSTSIYAQYRVFQTAAQAGIKVMLDGQGADELFGGYSQFWNAQVASFLKKGDWRSAYTLTKNLKKNESHPRLRSQAKQVLEVLSFFLPDSLGGIGKKVLGKGIFPSWLDAKWFMNRGILPCDEFKVSRVSLDPFREKVAQSLTQSSLPMLLRYEDRNSMRFSIESRVPFLAPDLIRFAHSLPSKYLLPKNGISKYVFRQAMRGIVPDEILDRRDKIGFETPQVAWLKSNSAWVHQILNSAYASKIPFFNQKEIKKMESKIPVWRLVNFIFWAEQLSVELE